VWDLPGPAWDWLLRRMFEWGAVGDGGCCCESVCASSTIRSLGGRIGNLGGGGVDVTATLSQVEGQFANVSREGCATISCSNLLLAIRGLITSSCRDEDDSTNDHAGRCSARFCCIAECWRAKGSWGLILNPQVTPSLAWYKLIVEKYLQNPSATLLIEDIAQKYADEAVWRDLDSPQGIHLFEAGIILRESQAVLSPTAA
jgi:hypothetical protein